MNQIIDSQEIDLNAQSFSQGLFKASRASEMPKATAVMMVNPTHFDIKSPLNAHMQNSSGGLNTINRDRAMDQWMILKSTYERLGVAVHVTDNIPEGYDQVFSANPGFPFISPQNLPKKAKTYGPSAFATSIPAESAAPETTFWQRGLIPSRMRFASRQREVSTHAAFFSSLGYQIHDLFQVLGADYQHQEGPGFEGMGDALWVPGRNMICGGYGPRTDKSAYDRLSEFLNTQFVLFSLSHPKFYHLDTCLSILDDRSVIACKEGFSEQGFAVLNKIFDHVFVATLEESDSPGFACNAHCPDGRHVIMQQGSARLEAELSRAGFVPVPVDTSEFVKSGGSVFCMKQIVF